MADGRDMVSSIRVLAAAGAIALHLIAELIAPSRCAACDGPVRRTSLFCEACASTVERTDITGVTTRAGSWVAAFEYGGAIATAISRLKYQDRSDLGPRLGRAMDHAARRFEGAIDLVVPVPLHPRRLSERGYNQAALLAAPVARRLGVPLEAGALRRVHETSQQVGRDRQSRLLNVDGVFAAHNRAIAPDARILLVDDVRTTGATLHACARAFHQLGAHQVFALVLARRA